MKEQARTNRAHLFTHLDGLVVLPTLAALQRRGVHVHLLDRGQVDVDELADRFEGNAGYLNVALRLMASQGWLEQIIDGDQVGYRVLTDDGRALLRSARVLEGVGEMVGALVVRGPLNEASTLLEGHTALCEAIGGRDLPPHLRDRLLRMAEGLVGAPLLTHLAMRGARAKMDHRGRPRLANLPADDAVNARLLLQGLGWCVQDDPEAPVLTTEAAFFAQRASAYGVTVSYLRTMHRLDELLFGRGDILWDRPDGAPETHVDRTMNMWGSGGAHAAYFKRVDELVIGLFNRPIEEQPLGIADMGSGDGTLLTHLFDLIHDHTLRGRMLEKHPLLVIGADYNAAARESTRATLAKADVWGEVMFGDVSDPERLARDLMEQHGANLGDLLNLRTFIDHNRIFSKPKLFDVDRVAGSTGAFAFRGERLSVKDVEQDLCDHLRRWTPYLKRFGLLVIELHTLPPALAAANLGLTAVTAYDGTHGYSDQYIVEHDVFLRVAAEAGLRPVAGTGRLFPSAELPVISVNWLRSGR